MNRALWRIVLLIAMVFTGPAFPAAGQQLAPPNRVPGIEKPRLTFQRQFFEKHFESLHPLPRPAFGGAVAGSRTMDLHRQRAVALQQRIAALQQIRPFATSSVTGVLPGLETRLSLGSGSYPTSVVSGDFNADGHVDFAVANGGTNDVWIYLGKGDNTFQIPRVVQLRRGQAPIYLATADLRGMGTLDLVVAEYDSSTVGVLLGNGDGTFANEQIYSLPQPPGAIAIDDFNHDGRPDVAIALANDYPYRPIPRLALLTGNGDGTFAQPIITYDTGFFWNDGAAYNVDSGDVDGDGLPDLLITAPLLNTASSVLSGNTTVYLNNGDGTFRVGQTIVSASYLNLPVDGRLADVDGDGCLDALIADLSEVVWVSPGDCSGNFGTTREVPMGEAPTALRVADINGDGHLDLIASSAIVQQVDYSYPAGNTISVALGDGKGNFGVARVYGGNSESFALAVGDFRGNGRPSVVTADVDTDTTTIFGNDGTGDLGFPEGLYSGRPLFGDVEPFTGYTFADLNGDGIPDFFQLGAYDNVYAMSYLNDGTGHIKPPLRSTFGPGVTNFAMGDFRLGDFRNTGHLDLVAIGISSEYTTASQLIFFQPGNGDGTFGPATQVTATGAGGAMTTGDFNADGKLDFVAINGGLTHTLTPFFGHSDGTFTAGTALSFTDANPDIGRVFTGDFNRDGKTDVLVFTTGNGYWTTNSAVWEFDGNGNGTFQTGRQLFAGFQPFALADLNHDGHPDIARYDTFWPDGTTETFGPARLTNYVGQADGSFAQVSTYAPYGNATHPWNLAPYSEFGDPLNSSIAADYSGDGNVDELAFQEGNGYARAGQMLMGHGDGTFTPTYDEFVFPEWMHPLYAYDLTGDGLADTVMYDGGGRMTMIRRGAPAPALQLALQNEVISGAQNCGTVFADIASLSDRTVSLTSSVVGVTLPSSVSLPADALSTDFCYTLSSSYDSTQVHDVSATLDGSTATAYASQAYIPEFSLSVDQPSTQPVYSGTQTPPVTVTVTPQANYGSTVNLSCAALPPGYTCQFTPNQLVISPGAPATAQLVVSTVSGTFPTAPITIVADDGNVAQRQAVTLTVVPLGLWSPVVNAVIQEPSPGTGSTNLYVSGIPPYSFQCSGLPAGASCSFAGTQNAYPSSSSITLTVTSPPGLASANSTFQVEVQSGGHSTSLPVTLSIFSLAVLAPPADQDWALAGTPRNISFPVQSSNLPPTGMTLRCALDGTTVCETVIAFPANSPLTVLPQMLSIPAGMPPGQHQLTLTTSILDFPQTFTFPLYVADFSGSLDSTSVTTTRGGSATATGTLSATVGFSSNVSVSCSITPAITCSVTPSSVQLNGGAPQKFTVTVTAGALAMQKNLHKPLTRSRSGGELLAFVLLLPFGLAMRHRRSSWRAMLTLLAAFGLACGIISCGGGGGSAGGTGGNGSGAGSGSGTSHSYTVTVYGAVPNYGTLHDLGTVTVTVTH